MEKLDDRATGPREAFLREHPGFPLLDPDEPRQIVRFLEARGWLEPGERLLRCGRLGGGNMNLTLRLETSSRKLVLKQARPWVEKYPHIAAPADRLTFEARFYRRAASLPEVARCMPRLLASHEGTGALLLEEVEGARDGTGAYRGERIDDQALEDLGRYLCALHAGTRSVPDPAHANRAMRALNHAHLFVVPLDPDNTLALDELEPGLARAASDVAGDDAYRDVVAELGRRYLEDGPCLVHGDFFPGSWLLGEGGPFVIDAEFSFHGDPELDVGMAIAHLALARQERGGAELLLKAARGGRVTHDVKLLAGYAGVEVMRRLIGVAQLPIAPSEEFRARLLKRSRDCVLRGEWRALWG